MQINDFFKEETKEVNKSLEGGNGILEDLSRWTSNYSHHLINSGKSSKTLDNYTVTLNAFEIFIARYYSSLSGIGKLSCELHVNDFLSWMEDYQTSKEYGSIKERIERLLSFIHSTGSDTSAKYKSALSDYFIDMDDLDVDINEYVLNDFLSYISSRNINLINKESISDYIETRPKVKLVTMNQHKIAIVAFLKFIDRSIGYEKFESDLWHIKQYNIAKNANKLKTGFNESDQEKIINLLSIPPQQSVQSLKKIKKISEYVEWRTRAMMLLMMRAGLRTSEAINLTFNDITLSKDGEAYFLNVLGKGNKFRRVPIKKTLFDPYLNYLSTNKISDYLSATHPHGLPQNRSNLYTMVKKRLHEAGVSQHGLHIFRHHYGSRFASENGNIKALQQLLGHRSIETTMIYSEIDDHELLKHVKKTHQ